MRDDNAGGSPNGTRAAIISAPLCRRRPIRAFPRGKIRGRSVGFSAHNESLGDEKSRRERDANILEAALRMRGKRFVINKVREAGDARFMVVFGVGVIFCILWYRAEWLARLA